MFNENDFKNKIEDVFSKKELFNFEPDMEEIDPMIFKNRKPRICLIADVPEWAWDIKSNYLKKYLSNEFDITIKYIFDENGKNIVEKIDRNYYDLYFTFGSMYIRYFKDVPTHKKVTGVTAHRKKEKIYSNLRIAGHLHANSIMLKEELELYGFKNVYYVPNGVDEKDFHPYKNINKQGLVFGHVGKKCEEKGQRKIIIPAIQKTRSKGKMNLNNWKNKIPHEKMIHFYNDIDVVVIASSSDGTPNCGLEAAACGRPIISNYIGNMPELIRKYNCGILVERKLEAYIDAINWMKKNKDKVIKMGKNARIAVEKEWNWKNQSENYRKMFKDILKLN